MEFSCPSTSNPEIESSIGPSCSSESESESSVQEESTTVSLLSRLRAPNKSDLCEKGRY